jgi:sulfide:quinone oxidoreductase
MAFKKITPSFSAAPQLTRDDVAAAAQAGFRSIVSSRPNGEEQGQPSAHEMARIAEEHGLAFAHVPIVPGKATDADADRMKEAARGRLPYGRWRRRVMPIPKRSSVRPRQPGTTWPI